MVEQAEKRRWRKCLVKTAQFVKAGGSLADGFEEADPDGFPAAFLEMVRGGEHSGRLAEVFQSLSVYYERRYKAKQKMETSLIYPCFVLGMAVLVLTFIVGWVVPSIAAVLKEMGIDLPLGTKILLSISGFLQEHIVALLSAVILAIGGVVCYWKSERGREQLEMIIKKLPMIGKLWDMSIYAQFCHTVATLLQAGVPLPQVLVVTGRFYRQPAHREKDPSGGRKTPGRRITWDVDERRWNISADFERSLCHRRRIWRAGVHAGFYG